MMIFFSCCSRQEIFTHDLLQTFANTRPATQIWASHVDPGASFSLLPSLLRMCLYASFESPTMQAWRLSVAVLHPKKVVKPVSSSIAPIFNRTLNFHLARAWTWASDHLACPAFVSHAVRDVLFCAHAGEGVPSRLMSW